MLTINFIQIMLTLPLTQKKCGKYFIQSFMKRLKYFETNLFDGKQLNTWEIRIWSYKLLDRFAGSIYQTAVPRELCLKH